MSQSLPSVSVILPVHNGERFIAGAIQNIQSQQYHPLEIIVVDDGSTDSTPEILTQFKSDIQCIQQLQAGPSAARNRGIKAAQGEVIAFLDVDDLWPDNMLLTWATYLAEHPDVDIVQGLIQRMQMVSPGKSDGPIEFEPVFDPYPFINIGSALYRRSVYEKIGLYDEALWDNEDTDWFTRAWENNILKVLLPEVMLFYRKHDRNMTLEQKDLVFFGLIKIYKRHLDRLRSEPALATRRSPMSWADYLGKTPD